MTKHVYSEQEISEWIEREGSYARWMQQQVEHITASAWAEYDSAANWCARRGIKGKQGDALPANLSSLVLEYINEDPEAFERRVREFAYGKAMNALVIPEE